MGQQQSTATLSDEQRRESIQKMDSNMRRKFARGAAMNLKVVIRGDRKTGKTQLWRRVQQKAFEDEYVPTAAIQIAHINWAYKMHDDPVLVEVWDVVDHLLHKDAAAADSSALKLQHTASTASTASTADDNASSSLDTSSTPTATTALSSDMLDVYQHAQCAIFLLDPHKEWTFEYVEREVPKVPAHCFVLVLCNFTDDDSPTKVSPARILSLVSELNEGASATVLGTAARARALRCALKDDFGLNAIVSSFNIPYLATKRQQLLQQMQTVETELEQALREHDEHSSAQNYQTHKDLLAELERNRGKGRKATAATAPIAIPTSSVASGSTPASANATPLTSPLASPRLAHKSKGATEASPHAAGTDSPPVAASPPAALTRTASKPAAAPLSEKSSIDKNSIKATAAKQAPPAPIEKTNSFFSRMKRRLTGVETDPMKLAQQKAAADLANAQVKEATISNKPIADVDEFNAGDLDDSYWGADEGVVDKVASAVGLKKKTSVRVHEDSDGEDDAKPPAGIIITQDEDLAGDIVPVALPAAGRAAPKPTAVAAAPAAKTAAAVTAKPAAGKAPAPKPAAEDDDDGWGGSFGGDDDSDDDAPSGNAMMLADEDLDGPEQVFEKPAAKHAAVFKEPAKAAPKKNAAAAAAAASVDEYDDVDNAAATVRDGFDDFDAPAPAATAAPPAKVPPSARLPQPKQTAAVLVEADEDPFGEVAAADTNSLVLDEEDPFGGGDDVFSPAPPTSAARGRGRGGAAPPAAARARGPPARARGPPGAARGAVRGATRPGPRRPSRAPSV